MSIDNGCFYCVKDQRLADLMIEISDLKVSTLYLFKEQTYKGRCVLAYKGHENHLTELADGEFDLYMKDLAKVGKAIMKTFTPDKINYGAYSDTLAHLHFHIVPKYQGGPSWSQTFTMMPEEKVFLTEEEYAQMVQSIKNNL